jgi:hypothetical protein
MDEAPPDVSGERARKVILCVSDPVAEGLDALVAQWQRDRIAWIAVVGPNCAEVEHRIKAFLAADVANRARFVMTSAHPTETLEDVIDFMLSLVGEYEGDAAIVEM